jgi:hypothetical protein
MLRGKSMMILVAGLVMAFAQAARADAPSRIQFARGKSSALVKGSTGDSGATYVMRVNGGQVLMLDLSPRAGVGIKVSLEGRDGLAVLLKEESGGDYELGLEETGDYTIFIGSTTGKSTSFALSVKTRKMKDI